MKEILTKRTYNEKVFDLGAGQFKMQTHIGHIHYKDDQGDFQESNFTPVDQGTYWEMTKHNYHLRVAKDFSAPILIQYKNKYAGADHTITYEPHSIAWFKPSTDDVQIFRSQQAVQGVYDPAKNSFYYTNAFGPGIDFEITMTRHGFKKEVVIPSKPGTFPTAPSAQHRMVALFKYGGTALKVLNKQRQEWDKQTRMEDSENEAGFELEESNPLYKSFIRPAYAIDAEGNTKSLRVIWHNRGGQLWQIKEIPLKAMENATFPVRFDTVTDYYTGAGDGACYNSASAAADWAGYRSLTASQFANTTGEYLQAASSSPYRLGRVFYPVDTSGLPDGATITAASLFLAVKAISAGGRESRLCKSTQASGATLVVGDFDNIGTLGSPDYVSDAISATWTVDVVREIAITDLTVIDTTGYTKMVLMDTVYDIGGATPTDNKWLQPYTSIEAGTGSDPYLEVTYSAFAATPTLTASVAAAGTIAKTSSFARALTASITAAATVGKGFTQALTASITAAASIGTLALQVIALTASITASAAMTQVTTFKRTLTGSATAAATITKMGSFFRTLTGSATAAATITATKTFFQALTASITAAASVVNGGAIRTTIVTAAVAVAAKIHILFYKRKYTKEDEDYKRKY